MAGPRKASPKRKKRTDAIGPFERVWSIVKRIPRGRVATYGQVAAMIDHRLSPVGIGWAMRAAPDESIPWHRVVNASGGISTDREHPGLQRAMLEADGVTFDADGLIDLARARWRPRPRQ
jgi:methylated-DNA-protein-cysteine methyltransferase-like protein